MWYRRLKCAFNRGVLCDCKYISIFFILSFELLIRAAKKRQANRKAIESNPTAMTTEDLRNLERSVSAQNFYNCLSFWCSIKFFFNHLFSTFFVCMKHIFSMLLGRVPNVQMLGYVITKIGVCATNVNRSNVPVVIWIWSRRGSHRSKRHCYSMMMSWTVFRWWKCSNRWLKWKMSIKICTKTSKKCSNCKKRWPPHCSISCEACDKRSNY